MLLFCIYTISINNAQESQKSVVQKKIDDTYIEDRPFLEKGFPEKILPPPILLTDTQWIKCRCKNVKYIGLYN